MILYVWKGGGFKSGSNYLQVSCRSYSIIDYPVLNLGLRIVVVRRRNNDLLRY